MQQALNEFLNKLSIIIQYRLIVELTIVSVAPKYDRIAPIYELIDLPLKLLIFKKWRREALSCLNGKILEVGVGT